MRFSSSPKFEGSLNRASNDSMRGKKGELERFSGLPHQFPQDSEKPVAVLIVECEEGKNFSTRYSDRRFIELRNIYAVYTYETEDRRKLIDRLRKAEERARKKTEAEAAVEAERERKRTLIRHVRDQEKQFDELARKSF